MKLSFLKRPNIPKTPEHPKKLSLDTITKYTYSQDIDTTSTKPRVAILISGGMRSCSLNPDYSADNIILDSVKMHFLNDEFKSKYDYDVFISTDKILLHKAFEFYGNNLRNVHLLETNEYLHECKSKIPDYKYFRDNYLKKDFRGMYNYIGHLEQNYRLYCAYNMMTNFMNDNNIKYDYIVRTRPDSRIMQAVLPIFNTLESSNIKHIFVENVDQLVITKFQFHEMFKLVCYYGDYLEDFFFLSGAEFNSFCGEAQGSAHNDRVIREQGFKSSNMDSEIIIKHTHGSYNFIYRGNGVYAYTHEKIPPPDTPGFVWNESMFRPLDYKY